MGGSPAEPVTITPDSIPAEQLEELLALLEAGGARLAGPHGDEHLLPGPLHGLMAGLLGALKRGTAVTALPHHALLTTGQAAQHLNVSRPYLERLIEHKTVPVVMVGSQRRIRLHDVMRLREERQQMRRRALDELSELGRDMQSPVG